MTVIEVVRPLHDLSDVTTSPDYMRIQVGPGHLARRVVAVTDPDTFVQTFASRPTPTPRIHCIITLALETYINEPVWNRMDLNGNLSRDYLLCCSEPPDISTTLLRIMDVLQNRELASKVHEVDELRHYNPNQDPYLLPNNHHAAGYKYCSEVFTRWVLYNDAIDKEERDRRVKDVVGMLLLTYIF